MPSEATDVLSEIWYAKVDLSQTSEACSSN